VTVAVRFGIFGSRTRGISNFGMAAVAERAQVKRSRSDKVEPFGFMGSTG
jgi:hypothetical protein